MKIKEILDEIANEGGSNAKMVLLNKHSDNELLERVLYLAHSPRVKFYLKQIPAYVSTSKPVNTLDNALTQISAISDRKVTGGSATMHLKCTLESLDIDDAHVIERIIDKSSKIGMGTTYINKVFPKLIEKTPYQGAKPFSEALARKLFLSDNAKKYGIRSDIKMDGRYANAIIRDGEVELVSRQGEITHVGDAKFLQELALFPDGVLNGELTIDGLDRYTANGIVASIVDIEGKREDRGEKETGKKIKAFGKKHGPYWNYINMVRFTVWDRISTEDYFNTKSDVPYWKRRKGLAQLLQILPVSKVSMVKSKLIYTYEEAIKHFQEALSNGEEGTIIKATDGAWKNGKPTWQIKMKLEINLDLKIVGFNYGNGKNSEVISSIDVESSEGTLKTAPAGMSEDMMQHVTDNQDDLLGTIVEIKCCGVSQNSAGEYSSLHPTFIKLRDDKSEANTLEECIEIDEASKNLV